MDSVHEPPQDKPGPSKILKALRRACSDDSSLKTTPLEEVSRQLIVRGYLQGELSPTLVADVVEVMQAVNRRPGHPTLWPCAVEDYWNEGWQDNLQDELYMAIEWGDFPPIWDERTMPRNLTRAPTPPCTDLISEPGEILRNEERRPIHLCGFEFMSQSTRLWAEAQPFVDDSLNILRWAYMHPLPIGRQALMSHIEVDNLSEWSEVLNVLPFEEHETAMWALRVKVVGSLSSWSALDLFGLADYPTDLHKKYELPAAGNLAYVLRGRDASPIDLVHNAKRWWSRFRGRSLLGRPRGSGTWANVDEFRVAVGKAVQTLRAHGRKVTQESVAEILSCDDRVLRQWLTQFGLDWRDVSKAR